jgi:hypothetical protein
VLVLAACGSQAKSVEVKKKAAPSPRKVILASIRATTAAKSARVSMTSSAGSGSKTLNITADGVADFANGDGVVTVHATGVGKQFDGIEGRLVGGAVYVKMPESLSSVFGDKWLKMPAAAPVGLLPGFDQSDPSKFLAYLETVSSGVTKVGSDTIRGVETTHYEAILDLAKAVDRANVPASLRDDLGKIVHKNEASLTIPADVWVDNDGLARRIQLKLDLAKLGGPDGGTDVPVLTMSMDLYDFGVPVHVEAPPAGETVPFPVGPSGTVGTPS